MHWSSTVPTSSSQAGAEALSLVYPYRLYLKSQHEIEPFALLAAHAWATSAAGSTPSPGILPQQPPVQLDFTSGNSSKEIANNHNVMATCQEKETNSLKSGINLQWKTSHGVFPWEVLEAIQWVGRKRWGEGEGMPGWGTKGKGPQGLLPAWCSWTKFRFCTSADNLYLW